MVVATLRKVATPITFSNACAHENGRTNGRAKVYFENIVNYEEFVRARNESECIQIDEDFGDILAPIKR